MAKGRNTPRRVERTVPSVVAVPVTRARIRTEFLGKVGTPATTADRPITTPRTVSVSRTVPTPVVAPHPVNRVTTSVTASHPVPRTVPTTLTTIHPTNTIRESVTATHPAPSSRGAVPVADHGVSRTRPPVVPTHPVPRTQPTAVEPVQGNDVGVREPVRAAQGTGVVRSSIRAPLVVGSALSKNNFGVGFGEPKVTSPIRVSFPLSPTPVPIGSVRPVVRVSPLTVSEL